MAGRGTDIMLGGNAEFMAKNDLRKAGFTDELIAEATGYAETDSQEILEARKLFAEKLASTRRTSPARRTRSGRPEGCSSSARSATSPAGLTTSSGAARAARGTPARRSFISPWRTI